MGMLERLKSELHKQGANEQNQVYSLCAVMEICGGYNQLLDLSLPALKQIINYIEFLEKETKKQMPKMKR